jgi:tetratricopeptide (TPR) repeat protein
LNIISRFSKQNHSDLVKRIILFLGILSSLSCSQFSHSPTSKAWHNLNARYNAVIDAKTYYNYSVFLIDSAQIEDYSKTLPILHRIDSNYTKISKKGLDEVVRLTSLVAERHSNSRHLDDAYLLLGQARYYQGKILSAIEVFKYLNTHYRKEDMRHAALIWMMKSYMEINSYSEAEEVINELEKLSLSKANKTTLYEARAALYQRQGQNPLAAVYLEEALKNMKKSTRKARGHFIAGQLYRNLQRGSLARKNWMAVAKNKPTYELEFNAGIELLMLNSDLGSNANFAKMLEDRKNSDLKDKIYFKQAESKAKQGQYQSAVADYTMSAQLARDNIQKSAAYNRIAEVYYQNLNNYALAAKYYDSTLRSMTPMMPGYQQIVDQSRSLSDYVRYTGIINTEDSLQALAALNPLELDNRITVMLEAEDALAKQKAEEDQKAEQEKQNRARSGNPGGTAGIWLFYDQTALTRSRAAFIREWGNRPLEDNWRRKDKETGSISFRIERGTTAADLDEVNDDDVLKEREDAKRIAAFESKKQAILERIPTTEYKMITSKRRQEEAYYQLGKIYRLQFNQPVKSKATFSTLLNKFPTTSYEQEVLYFMALMSDNPSENEYKDRLIEKYPFSTYARQLQRGNVQITSATESNAERDYEVIFSEYKAGDYNQALDKADKALFEYTGTALEDKIAMIRILLLAKLQDSNKYRIALLDFVQSYPSSNLKPQAESMLAAMTKK